MDTMFEYLPHMMKETSDAKRAEMLREAEIERRANQVQFPRKRSLLNHLRTIVHKVFSL